MARYCSTKLTFSESFPLNLCCVRELTYLMERSRWPGEGGTVVTAILPARSLRLRGPVTALMSEAATVVSLALPTTSNRTDIYTDICLKYFWKSDGLDLLAKSKKFLPVSEASRWNLRFLPSERNIWEKPEGEWSPFLGYGIIRISLIWQILVIFYLTTPELSLVFFSHKPAFFVFFFFTLHAGSNPSHSHNHWHVWFLSLLSFFLSKHSRTCCVYQVLKTGTWKNTALTLKNSHFSTRDTKRRSNKYFKTSTQKL